VAAISPPRSPAQRPTGRRSQSNVSERVYIEIRARISDGRYRLNQHLVETELAAELASSRTPIRQGLQKLEIEGLVIASRSGWIVREHTADDIKKIYEVRVPLEGYATRLAAERGSDAQLARMVELHTEANTHLAPEARAEFVRLHDEFHQAVLRAAGNDVLWDAVRRYRDHPYNRRVARSYTDDELHAAVRHHELLIAAITARDADEAERLGREHLVLSREVTLAQILRLG
jgi:DNA-binding GntR family transcriptional regulator